MTQESINQNVNLCKKEINENVNLFKYIVRFCISYQLLIIVIAIIITILDFGDGNIVTSMGAIYGAVSFTMSKFIEDNERIPSEIEKKKLVWYSFFASWLVPLIAISPIILYSYGTTYIIDEMRKIESWWFAVIVLVFSLVIFYILRYSYGLMAKEYLDALKQAQPTKKSFFAKKKVWIPLSIVFLVTFLVVNKNNETKEKNDLKITEYQKVLKHKLATLKKDAISIAETYSDFGHVYISKGEYNTALENYEKALKIHLMNFKENDYDSADYYEDIAYAYHLKEQYEKSLKFYEKSIKIQSSEYGEGFLGVGIVYNDIGYVYLSKGEYDLALKYHEKALKIKLKENKNGNYDNSVSIAYLALADTYFAQYEFAKAYNYSKKYYNIKYK